jgi:hypothetical protein
MKVNFVSIMKIKSSPLQNLGEVVRKHFENLSDFPHNNLSNNASIVPGLYLDELDINYT